MQGLSPVSEAPVSTFAPLHHDCRARAQCRLPSQPAKAGPVRPRPWAHTSSFAPRTTHAHVHSSHTPCLGAARSPRTHHHSLCPLQYSSRPENSLSLGLGTHHGLHLLQLQLLPTWLVPGTPYSLSPLQPQLQLACQGSPGVAFHQDLPQALSTQATPSGVSWACPKNSLRPKPAPTIPPVSLLRWLQLGFTLKLFTT